MESPPPALDQDIEDAFRKALSDLVEEGGIARPLFIISESLLTSVLEIFSAATRQLRARIVVAVRELVDRRQAVLTPHPATSGSVPDIDADSENKVRILV